MSDKLLPASSWDYHPAMERFKENAISMGVAVGYGVALGLIFNPLVIGGLVAVSFGIAARHAKIEAQQINEEYPDIPGLEPSDPFDRVHRHYSDVIEGYSAALQMPKQRFFYVNKDIVWSMSSLYDAFKLKYKRGLLKEKLDHLGLSISTSRLVLMSRQFINKHSNAAVNFVLAHEVSHAKSNDGAAVMSKFWQVRRNLEKYLIVLVAGAVMVSPLTLGGAPLVPALSSLFSTGVSAVVGVPLFIATSFAAKLGLNYVSRMMERRADRNAIFLTRDVQGATDLLVNAYKDEPAMKKPKWAEIGTHPSFKRRIDNLQESFALASQYEPLDMDLPKPTAEVLEASSKDKPYYRFAR